MAIDPETGEWVHDYVDLSDNTVKARIETSRAEEGPRKWVTQYGYSDRGDELFAFGAAVRDQFTSGGNFAYQAAKTLERKIAYEADPTFDPEEYVKLPEATAGLQKEDIEQLKRAESVQEAQAIRTQIAEQREAQKRLQNMGLTGQLVSGMLAGMIDIDTIPALLTGTFAGKAGIMSTRLGRMAAGGSVAASSAAVGTAADPTGDWINVPVAGLLGAGLAGLGRVEIETNASLRRVADELDAGIRAGTLKPEATMDISRPVEPGLAVPRRETVNPVQEAVEAASAPENAGKRPTAVKITPEEARAEAIDAAGAKVNDLEVADEVGEAWAAGATSGAGRSTLGAAGASGSNDLGFSTSSRVQDIVDDTKQWHGRHNTLDETYSQTTTEAGGAKADAHWKAADAITRVAKNLKLGTDFDNLWQSRSLVAKRLAATLMESSSGRIRNNLNAAAQQRIYSNQMLETFYRPFRDARTEYLRGQGYNAFERGVMSRGRGDFDRAVYTELEARRLDGTADQTGRAVDPAVAKAADAVDRISALDVEFGKGRPGELSWEGYQALTAYSGYSPRRMTGARIVSFVNQSKGRYSEKDVLDALAEAYADSGKLDRTVARQVAEAIVTRAKATDRGTSASVYGLIQNPDARAVLEEGLKRQGMTEKQVERLVEKLVGTAEERGKAGHLKHRLEMDARFVASNGIRIMDLMDTDLEKIWTRRARSTSGRAALARQGIQSNEDIKDWISAVLHEQQNTPNANVSPLKDPAGALYGNEGTLSREYLEDLFGAFTGNGTRYQEMDAIARRLARSASLGVMSQVGFSQLAETGPMIGAAGYKEFFRNIPAAVRSDLHNPRSDLIQEFKVVGTLTPEEDLFSPHIASEVDFSTGSSQWVQHFDAALASGQQLQGIISGMNFVRASQQRMAVMITTDGVMRNVAGKVSKLNTTARLRDIGIIDDIHGDRLLQKLKTELQHVEWDGDSVKKLNMDNWNPDTKWEFIAAVNRARDQYVQKPYFGEGMQQLENPVARLMTQFLSYPITALNKQYARGARIGDPQAVIEALYGFATAGAAWTARQVANGREDRLDPISVAKGALAYNNQFGWLPLAWDPLAFITGFGDYRFNEWDRGGVLRTPPAISIVGQQLGIPGALAGALDGKITASEHAALRTFPVFGSMLGVTSALNAMREAGRQQAREEAAERRRSPEAQQKRREQAAQRKAEREAEAEREANDKTKILRDAGIPLARLLP